MLNLKTLLEKGTITEKAFNNQEIVEGLKLNGSVINGKKTPSRRYLKLQNPENVFLFLQSNQYNIPSIEYIDNYIVDMFDSPALRRDTIQKNNFSTKAKVSKSQKGLYISSLEKIDIKLDDEVVTITPQNGMGYFFFHTQKIDLFEDTVIVGVENYQVVWFAKKYQKFFQDKKVLFVVTESYFFQWIEDKENEYIHFGDYDLAGINIYLNTVVPRLKKAKKHSMFIPKNIESLMKKSKNSELYKDQQQYKNLHTSDENINALIKIIHKYKSGLEQEGLYYMDDDRFL